MASRGEGRPGEARLWLELARRTIAARTPALDGGSLIGNWPDILHAHLLLREAEQIVQGGPGLGDGPKAEPTPPKGVRLRAELALGYVELAAFLQSQGKLDEAVNALSEAVRLKPNDAGLSIKIGNFWQTRGKGDEAAVAYREAVRLRPDDALAHYLLANTLRARGKLEDAAGEYRDVIRLDGNHVGMAPFVLGDMLHQMGRHDEALAVFRRILELAPGDPRPDRPVDQTLAPAHSKIGRTLVAQGKLDEALAEYREAFRLNPNDVEARRRAALADRLPALLKGDEAPRDMAERLALVQLCRDAKRHAAAARLAAEAMEADPKLGDDLRTALRYKAAGDAALAAAGQGKDEPPPDDSVRARWRGKALAWLRADLALHTKQLDTDAASVRAALAPWTHDSDIAGVRDPDALTALPEDERAGWQALWAEVDRLMKGAGPAP